MEYTNTALTTICGRIAHHLPTNGTEVTSLQTLLYRDIPPRALCIKCRIRTRCKNVCFMRNPNEIYLSTFRVMAIINRYRGSSHSSLKVYTPFSWEIASKHGFCCGANTKCVYHIDFGVVLNERVWTNLGILYTSPVIVTSVSWIFYRHQSVQLMIFSSCLIVIFSPSYHKLLGLVTSLFCRHG